MKPEIFDNFLPPEQFRIIADTIMGEEFPWFFCPGKSYSDVMKNDKTIFQFFHLFYMNHGWISQFGQMLDPILQVLKPVAIIRIKANMTTITPTLVQYDFHRDTSKNLVKSKTACFYVNTNNGYTVFNSGERVESVANRLVVFNSDNLHTGTSSTDESRRIVINFNYFTQAV
jgi:hypothetical protein